MNAEPARRGVPDATVGRLPAYRRALNDIAEGGASCVSSQELAAVSGVHPAQLRKDLSHLGSYGVRGVGYDVVELRGQISAHLGLLNYWPVAIVGMGNLGRALVAFEGFSRRGFHIVALVDEDPQIVGETIAGIQVQSLDELAASGISLDFGVITTPAGSANRVAQTLVDLGVHSILNFAATTLSVPNHVGVRQVDLSTELEILAFHAQRRTGSSPELTPRAAAGGAR
ncbi:MAG: redox-sensing transcriptional repressor Rex [Ornithinimicrobium sp.]